MILVFRGFLSLFRAMLSSELPCSKPHHHPHPYKTFFCSSSQKPPFMVKSPKTLSCATHIRYPLVHDPPPACAVLSRSLPSNSLPSVCSVDSAWPLSFHHVSWTRRILHQLGLHSRKNLAALTKQAFRVGGREFKRKKKEQTRSKQKGLWGRCICARWFFIFVAKVGRSPTGVVVIIF